MKRWILLFFLLFLPVTALSEGSLTLKTDDIKGYTENALQVTVPEAGSLLLRVSDQYNVYRTWRVDVQAGENTILWDGLGDNQERIVERSYTLRGEMTLADGSTVFAEKQVEFVRCEQAMTLALPSSDTLYLEDGDWFAELCMVRSGRYVMEIYRAEDLSAPVDVQRGTAEDGAPFKHRWKAKGMEPGEYVLRFYAEKNPAYDYDIPLTVKAGKAPVLPLTVTETFMPEPGDSDETIWQIMMQPTAVIDLKSTSHQNVYAEPTKQSDVLGTLHGMSQAVNVIEIRQDGWVRIAAWNHEQGERVEGYVPADMLMMVEPNDQYGLLLDKQAQTLAVYHQGVKITMLSISTGLMAKDKLFRETPAGSYLTLEHMEDFASEGYHYDYPIRYDGGNLLHQLGYKERSGRNDFTDHTPQLGSKASHGCIRLPNRVDEAGVNAYWLWTHLPYHTRLIILDDEETRTWQAAAAQAGRSLEKPTLTNAETVPELKAGETEIVLTLGGDAVLGTREAWWDLEESLPQYLEREGMAYPFSALQEILAADDMTFINLECVLKGDASGEDKDKQWRFRGLPSYTEILKAGSVEQVNIANNHYIDYGAKGKSATRDALTEAGVAFSGYGYTYVWDIKGHRIGFAGCRETTYKQDKEIIARDIEALRSVGCEVVVYSCHWGTEYHAAHNPLQEEMAKAAASAGADIVVGNHPHVVQGIERMNETLVLYSLGNLVFGGTHDMTTFDAMLAQVRLRFGEEGYNGYSLELIPILTSGSAPANDFRPVVATGDDKQRILDQVQLDSTIQLEDSMWFAVEERVVWQ